MIRKGTPNEVRELIHAHDRLISRLEWRESFNRVRGYANVTVLAFLLVGMCTADYGVLTIGVVAGIATLAFRVVFGVVTHVLIVSARREVQRRTNERDGHGTHRGTGRGSAE